MTETTEVTEHPIIFNEWSIRRILAGEKSQTRRILKHDAWLSLFAGELNDDGWPIFENRFGHVRRVRSPYGSIGDVLYVREAFRLSALCDGYSPAEYVQEKDERGDDYIVRYEADEYERRGAFDSVEWGRLRPSIHMPKALARIWLRVTDIRVERLHEIPSADAEAEGITDEDAFTMLEKHGDGAWPDIVMMAFRDKWNEIHGEGAWERNDWLWVVSFEPETKN